jgi:hypothetical protein
VIVSFDTIKDSNKFAIKLSRGQRFYNLRLTARQYGEVVLSDDSTGQGPGTLARNLSRCKEGMARVFAVMAGIILRTGTFSVQSRFGGGISHRTGI